MKWIPISLVSSILSTYVAVGSYNLGDWPTASLFAFFAGTFLSILLIECFQVYRSIDEVRWYCNYPGEYEFGFLVDSYGGWRAVIHIGLIKWAYTIRIR